MSVTKNNSLVRLVRKQIAEGFEKKESLPPQGSRFHKLGTIFSRTTGLIKSGVIPPEEAPIWYSVYRTFPPKYEPTFSRPPLDVMVKEIYFPEDKLRAAMKRWDLLDMKSTTPNASQRLVATFLEQRRAGEDDDAVIKSILNEPKMESGKDQMKSIVNEAMSVPTVVSN